MNIFQRLVNAINAFCNPELYEEPEPVDWRVHYPEHEDELYEWARQ